MLLHITRRLQREEKSWGRIAESDSFRRYLLPCRGSKKVRKVLWACDKMAVFRLFLHAFCSAASRWGHTVNLREERSTRKWRISWSKRDGHTPASARRRNSLPSASRCTPFEFSAIFPARVWRCIFSCCYGICSFSTALSRVIYSVSSLDQVEVGAR